MPDLCVTPYVAMMKTWIPVITASYQPPDRCFSLNPKVKPRGKGLNLAENDWVTFQTVAYDVDSELSHEHSVRTCLGAVLESSEMFSRWDYVCLSFFYFVGIRSFWEKTQKKETETSLLTQASKQPLSVQTGSKCSFLWIVYCHTETVCLQWTHTGLINNSGFDKVVIS